MIFGLGALLLVLAFVLRAVESSGAIPPAEFAPAAIVFRGTFPLAAGGIALLVVAAGRRLRDGLGLTTWMVLVGTALVLSSQWQALLMPIGVAVGTMGVLLGRRPEGLRLPEPGQPMAYLRSLGDAILALVPAGFLLVAIEWLVRTRGFVAEGLVDSELVPAYLGAVAGFGTSAILKAGVSLFRILLIGGLLLSLLGRWKRPWTPALAAFLLAGLLVVEQVRVLRLSLRDEIDQLALNPHLQALAIIALLFLVPLCERILRASPKLSDLPRAMAVIPGGSAPMRGLLINLMVLVGFLPLLYPQVEDYRERFFDCVAFFAIVFLTSLLVRSGLGRLSRLRPLALLVLLAGCLAFATLGQRSDLRLIAFEYSRFGAYGASAPWSHWVADRKALGFDQPDQTAPWSLDRTRIATTPRVDSTRPPILIFLWDAARPDRMSLHGYPRPTTPLLDALAPQALVFDQARSSATATTLGVRNMLSGSYNSRFMLAEDHEPFLVKALAEHGYDDFFVTVTDNDFNGISDEAFLRGWDSADHREKFHFHTYPNRDHIKPDAQKIGDLLDHLERRMETRGDLAGLFAYVHLTGTHTPWRNDDPVVDFGDSPLDRYDGELRKLDALLGRVLDYLSERGTLDETIVVITADHGTGLGEHGRLAGFLPYEEQLRIPLVMLVPGQSGSRVTTPTTHLDIAPTLVDLAGAGAWPGDGRILSGLSGNEPTETDPFVAFCAFQDSFAIYDPEFRFKLHHHRSRKYEALFDLQDDPGERRNILRDRPEMAQRLRAQLDDFLWQGRERYGNPYHYRHWQPAGR